MAHDHPYVSEAREGKPVCEWTVAILVCASGILAGLGYTTAATTVLVVTAVILGLVRLILRERSPWKVRSTIFDALMCLCLGLGLSALALSIHFMV
ncbi:DUF3017 domain-containing protein [Bifidobacterium thermophilum]|uniref:DUF3017 domain-containing protein n=1 Tax=Bifidobacterium thermophilum TaxID=33905 RepID=UPI0030A0A78E